MNCIWSDEERDFIRKHANNLKDLEIAEHLSKTSGRNVSLQAVRKQRQKMGLRKKPGRGVCGVVVSNGQVIQPSQAVSSGV